MKKRLINYGIVVIGITILALLAISCIALTPQPGSINGQKIANDRLTSGNEYYNSGDYDKAIADYTEAIRLNPNFASAYYNRGLAYRRKSDNDRAIADFDQVIKINPNAATAYANRGLAYYDKGNYDRVIADYNQAIQLEPTASRYNYRAWAYLGKGDYDSATDDFTKALQLDPDLARSKEGLELAQKRQPPELAQSSGQSTLDQVTPAQQASPYFTGNGGRGMRLGILAPEGQSLNAQLAYLPTMVQGVLVSSFSKYSGISVLDRISLDKVIAETLDPTYEDNLDIVRLGHVAQVGHMLTGKIIRTSSGYTLQLNITDTTPEAKTAAAYSGTCTVAQLDDHTAVQKAARELLTQLGVELNAAAIAELDKAPAKESISAQTALAQGIITQKQGNQNAALDYYTQATTLDPTLPEAAARFSTLADSVQGSKLAEKFNWLRAFAQTNGKYLFEISADENIPDQTLAFSGKNNITLTLRGRGANRTLTNSFTVTSGITLVLDNNITLRKSVNINSGGTLIMNNGSTISRINTLTPGVHMDGGTFTMNGGTISGNSGSGVNMGGGSFIMNNGSISNNDRGVYVSGTFTMNGGTISANTVRNSSGGVGGEGGGVLCGSNGTFTMNGGTISANTASSGGGVYVSGTFIMNGGTISGNTVRNSYGDISGEGGGVFVGTRGSFTMKNGTISRNIANSGGGIYGSNLTMSGGEISGNTARENGGGIQVPYYGIFTKTGGTITGYTGDTVNGNVVKNSSSAVVNFKGHAVYAGSADTLLKIKEGTAGPRDNMAYDGTRNPPTASGAWDN